MAPTQVQVFFVDEQDEWLVRHKPWYFNREGYIYNNRGGKKNALHRVIMQPGPGMTVDHINGIVWDNRRSNLRVVPPRHNCGNRAKPHPKNKSGFRGVHFDDSNGSISKPWVAQGGHPRKKLGRYATPDEAAQAAHVWRFHNQPGALG